MRSITSWPKDQLCLSYSERMTAVKAVEHAFASTLESLKVDIGLVDMLKSIYVPLVAWLVWRKKQQDTPLVVGLNGAQGAGKSTLFNLIEVIMTEAFNLNVVGFSIDDLYKTYAQRIELANLIHPLLQTRGVPGTHDVELGISIINSLKNSQQGEVTRIPIFDKSIDDRCPETSWQEWSGKADIIILEGWCVGAKPQPDYMLKSPINKLELEEDPKGIWRTQVNNKLASTYQTLFEQLEVLIMLKVPSMERVFQWRSLQERKLAERVKYIYDTQQPTEHLRIMNDSQIQRFIQHYERLTCYMLEEMPSRADITLCLNDNHKICQIDVNNPLELD